MMNRRGAIEIANRRAAAGHAWAGCLAAALVLGLACVGPAAAAAPQKTRIQALEEYQEALFQETGTGNLEQSRRIYQALAREVPYRDIRAACLYRLSHVVEKQGDARQAEALLREIVDDYPEQASVAANARERLRALIRAREAAEAQAGDDEPEPEPESEVPDSDVPEPPAPAPAPANPLGVWAGVHSYGAHAEFNLASGEFAELHAGRHPNGWLEGLRLGYYFSRGAAWRWYAAVDLSAVPPLTDGYYQTGAVAGLLYTGIPKFRAGFDLGYFSLQAANEPARPVQSGVQLRVQADVQIW